MGDNWVVGTFSTFHIIYMILIIPLMAGTLIWFKLKAKDEKKINLILYILSAILLVVIVIQRISIVYWGIHDGVVKDVFGEQRTYNWWMVLPDSVCGFTSLCVPIFVFAWRKKTSNYLIESVFTISILGSLGTVFYPDYLNFQALWQARCWGGLIHHNLSAWICMAMLLCGKITPTLKRWYLNPIAVLTMHAYGFFCLFVLKFCSCMNIASPLISGLFISSWYFLIIAYIAANTLFLLILYLVKRHKQKKLEKAPQE